MRSTYLLAKTIHILQHDHHNKSMQFVETSVQLSAIPQEAFSIMHNKMFQLAGSVPVYWIVSLSNDHVLSP